MQLNASAAASVLDQLIHEENSIQRRNYRGPIIRRVASTPSTLDAERANEKKIRLLRVQPHHAGDSEHASGLQTSTWPQQVAKSEKPPLRLIDKNIDAFLQHLNEVQLLECKTVDGSGTGAPTVILRHATEGPYSLRKLKWPFKVWMTSTKICSEPYVTFSVPVEKIAHQIQNSDAYFRSALKMSHPVLTVSVVLNVDLNDASVKREEAQFKRADQRAFAKVSLATAVSTNDKFVKVSETEADIYTKIVNLSVPARDISNFARVMFRPLLPGVQQIKVRGIAVWLNNSENVGEKDASQHAKEIFDGQKNEIASYGPSSNSVSNATISSVPSARESNTSTEKSSQPEVYGDVKVPNSVTHEVDDDVRTRQHEVNENSTLQEKTSRLKSCKITQLSIATAMKNKVLASLEKQELLSNQAPANHKTHHYNWMRDDSIAGTLTQSSVDAPSFCASTSALSGEVDKNQREVTALATLARAWEISAFRSSHQALLYCMRKSTAFSLILCRENDTRGISSALSSSFSFNIVQSVPRGTARSPKSIERDRNSPVHDELFQTVSRAETFGYTVELLFRCPFGFCCALKPRAGFCSTSSASHKLVLTISEDCGSPSSILSQSYEVASCDPEMPLASLRVVLDLTGSLALLVDQLRPWAARNTIRYYGDEGQSPLSRFVTESCLMENSCNSLSTKNVQPVSILLNNFVWSAMSIKVDIGDEATSQFLSTSMRYASPSFFAWQPQRSTPRVVLTSAHLLEYLAKIDGALVSKNIFRLVENYLAQGLQKDRLVGNLITMVEDPWQDLIENQEDVLTPTESKLNWNASCDAWMELRRRITAKFAFHALSTAFRREWRTVGICVPQICITACTRGPGNFHTYLLDQDALMDTVARWSYPFPRSIFFFYGHHNLDENECAVPGATRFPPFSPSALAYFAPVKNFNCVADCGELEAELVSQTGTQTAV